jgi:hypothetical protein
LRVIFSFSFAQKTFGDRNASTAIMKIVYGHTPTSLDDFILKTVASGALLSGNRNPGEWLVNSWPISEFALVLYKIIAINFGFSEIFTPVDARDEVLRPCGANEGESDNRHGHTPRTYKGADGN